MRFYIAGPMRGIPYFNFFAFDAVRDRLESQNNEVVSPADLDRLVGFDATSLPEDTDWNDIESVGFDVRAAIRRDLEALQGCEAIFMLRGWRRSKGATAEHAIAVWLGLEITGMDLHEPEPSPVIADILEEALAVTKGDRQNAYGPPDQDFRRTAGMWNALFADMLSKPFKPSHVAQAMILLKQSRQMHQNKRDNWLDTAGYARCGSLCDE